MADYYPFIVREVSKLHRDAGESRGEVYERAREGLVAKLRQPALRIPESEVSGELRAFDAAVRKFEAELARGQTLDAGLPPSVPSRTPSDSTGSISIIGSEAEPEIPQTEESQIRPISEGKSAPLAGAPDADSDLNRQMLHAIETALDLAVHPERSTNAIGKTEAEQQPTEANFSDPSSRKASGRPAQTSFPNPHSESVEPGETIFSVLQNAVVVHREDASFDRKSDFPPRTHFAVAVARAMCRQLINMTLAIAICCALFAAIYFSVSIGKKIACVCRHRAGRHVAVCGPIGFSITIVRPETRFSGDSAICLAVRPVAFGPRYEVASVSW